MPHNIGFYASDYCWKLNGMNTCNIKHPGHQPAKRIGNLPMALGKQRKSWLGWQTDIEGLIPGEICQEAKGIQIL